jgi:hypothetical protein
MIGTPAEELIGKGGVVRQFDTGATRDSDEGKNDYEGFLSPLVLEAYGDYMTEHRVQSDGSLRASDNWQLGMPLDAFMKSMLRHVFTLWSLHRGWPVKPERKGGRVTTPTKRDMLCAILFNVQGYLHELIKEDIGLNAPSTLGDSETRAILARAER